MLPWKEMKYSFLTISYPNIGFPIRNHNITWICIFQKVKIYAHQDDQPLKHGFPVSKLYDLLSLLVWFQLRQNGTPKSQASKLCSNKGVFIHAQMSLFRWRVRYLLKIKQFWASIFMHAWQRRGEVKGTAQNGWVYCRNLGASNANH